MENLDKGKFYGNSKKQFHINGLTIVDSEFQDYSYCTWHYHQNAHFAFTTKGHLIFRRGRSSLPWCVRWRVTDPINESYELSYSVKGSKMITF